MVYLLDCHSRHQGFDSPQGQSFSLLVEGKKGTHQCTFGHLDSWNDVWQDCVYHQPFTEQP